MSHVGKREIIVKMYDAGVSRVQIAAEVGVSESTVKRRIYEARGVLYNTPRPVSSNVRKSSIQEMILCGNTKRQIAESLGLAVSTIDKYVCEIQHETGENIRALIRKDEQEAIYNDKKTGIDMDFRGRRFEDVSFKS